MANSTTFLSVNLSATLALASMLGAPLPSEAGALPEVQKVPITLKASDLVPGEVMNGPNYKVKQKVKNDGFINTYRLNTDYGPLDDPGAQSNDRGVTALGSEQLSTGV